MYSVDDIKRMIDQGRRLVLAGDEDLLRELPEGEWIAGTIPYFMTEEGGAFVKDRLFATELPDFAAGSSIKLYDRNSIREVYEDAPENGLSIIIIPGSSLTHLEFALNVATYEGFASKPLIGWISGVELQDLGTRRPKIFCGQLRSGLEDGAVVMHVALPPEKTAHINIVNIFEQGSGDTIIFLEDGFSAREALVNGKRVNFADYLAENGADIRFPLVADYYGAMINVSFLSVDEESGEVIFYAPVFKGVEYKLARPITDYVADFTRRMPSDSFKKIVFSCNCILNYFYSELAGKKTGGLTGPITFGEIAYLLLNQTLVYATIGEAEEDR